MKNKLIILVFATVFLGLNIDSFPRDGKGKISFDFYGDSVEFMCDSSLFIPFSGNLSEQAVQSFYAKIMQQDYSPVIEALNQYKKRHTPDDWLYYQLIRKTAQHISPKAENYVRYTLYKWFFLTKSGYHATLNIAGNKLLFYVYSNENVYNIPSRISGGKQFVCLNYHDYGMVDFKKDTLLEVNLTVPEATNSFSYKITQLPDFNSSNYLEKDLKFSYYQKEHFFKVKLNPQVQTIFANYPVVDYSYYFNIPLSKETYGSLIPLLKKNIKGMNKKNGIDYLMRFTRYAFVFEKDSETFGKEKRMSPEETLLYKHSDCEDRAALFFYLLKEIYDLPMIVLVYPEHVTIAVELEKPVGIPIIHNGKKYTICDPTPQQQDLQLGQSLPYLSNTSYEVAYIYNPSSE